MRTTPLESGITVPVVHARIPVPVEGVPGAVVAQTRWTLRTLRTFLPPTERLLYYGGLGVMAVAGVLEWPVAAAVGAGVWVASRGGRHGQVAVQ